MAVAEELVVQIRAEVDRAVREMKKVDKQLGKTTDSTKKASTGMQNLGKALAVVGGAAIAMKAVRALANLTQESLNLAGAAEEVESKFRVVFGDEAADVREWADEFTSSIGRSEVATLGFLSSIQDTLVPLGLTRDAAAQMSKEVVELATDLGSFNNVATEDVIRDFQSALVGNTETLRKYGVVANQAQIEQFALNEGLIEAGQTLGPLEKAQAIYGLAVQGSSDAMGDAVRTAGSVVNTKRSLEDAVNDLKIAFGGLADDGVARAQGRMAEFVSSLAEVVNTKNIVGDVLDQVRAGDIAGIPLDELKKARGLIQEEGGAIQQAYENIILGNQREMLLDTVDAEIRARERAASLADDMAQTERDRAGTTQYIAEKTREEQVALESIAAIQRAIDSGLITEVRGLEEKRKLRQDEIDALEEAAIKTGTLTETQRRELETLRGHVARYDARLAELNGTLNDQSDAVDEVYKSYNAFLTNDELASAAERARSKLGEMTRELVNQQAAVLGISTSVGPAYDMMNADVAAAVEQVKEQNAELELQKQHYQDMANLVLGPVTSAFGELGKALGEGEDAASALGAAAISAIAGVLRALGQEFAVRAAAKFAEGLIPGNQVALAAAAGYTAASASAFAASGAVQGLASRERMADGGIVTSPTNALIGEAGPEAVIPLDRMGAMGGSTVINAPQITVNGSLVHERQLFRYLTNGQRKLGRGY